jgi:hypothetical protein
MLQVIFGIGGDEVAHFLEWVDFAGNAVQDPPPSWMLPMAAVLPFRIPRTPVFGAEFQSGGRTYRLLPCSELSILRIPVGP